LTEEIEQALGATPQGRFIQAFLDLGSQSHSRVATQEMENIASRLAESESDRAARLEVIHRQGSEISRMEAEVHLRLEENKKLWEKLNQEQEERKKIFAEWLTSSSQLAEFARNQQRNLDRMEMAEKDMVQARESLDRCLMQFQPLIQDFPVLARDLESVRTEKEQLQMALNKAELLVKQQGQVLSSLELDNKKLKSENDTQRKALQNQAIRLESLQIEVGQLKEEKQILNEEVDRLETILNDQHIALEDLSFQYGQLSQKFEKAQADIQGKDHQIQDWGKRFGLLQAENNELHERVAALGNQSEMLKQQLKNAKGMLQDSHEILFRVKNTTAVRLIKKLGGWQWLKQDLR
jgi:chromosome segregation ATPase